MYVVKKAFVDLQDDNFLNAEGAAYPREDYYPTKKRVGELLEKGFIEEEEDAPVMEEEEEDEPAD